MNISFTAAKYGDKPAIIMAESGESISYTEFNERSRAYAQWMHEQGLGFGDHVAIMMDNVKEFLVVCASALRSGLYVTPVNTHLSADDAAYIINDCGARILFISEAMRELSEQIAPQLATNLQTMLVDTDDSQLSSSTGHKAGAAGQGEGIEELLGSYMFYSSGTTGKPKGILQPMPKAPVTEEADNFMLMMQFMYAFTDQSVYLCPAPLYHTAPLIWSISMLQMGGTVVLMKKFDPLQALQTIEKYKVSHAQFVPTMFVRMLQLPEQDRQAVNLDSLSTVIHAAAPCPVDVKQAMLDWWGPIIHEYYSGSEGGGFVCVGPEEWLQRPGTVGKSMLGTIHIVGDDGNTVPNGEVGVVYFENDSKFEYHGDKEKTQEAYHEKGWVTMGDMGYIDDEGYLYLTDRKSHMIISGGVNIYPQEAENVLTLHPQVLDVAVIGVPHPEYGEEVKAVIQLKDPAAASEATERELLDYCLQRLSKYKCPRSIDFVDELPRLPTGKLLKRKLRNQYWPA